MQDTIIQHIIVQAGKEKVYDAISNPAHIIHWFPDVVEEGTLEEGQQPVFVFTEENHKSRIYVEAAKPHEYFAYRWVPGGQGTLEDVRTVPNTLVEFFIEEGTDGTKVTLKESGFASLPTDVAEKSLAQNTGGWKYMIGRLETFLNQ